MLSKNIKWLPQLEIDNRNAGDRNKNEKMRLYHR